MARRERQDLCSSATQAINQRRAAFASLRFGVARLLAPALLSAVPT